MNRIPKSSHSIRKKRQGRTTNKVQRTHQQKNIGNF